MREIIINNLTYTVGGATILDNLSLKIPARKFVGLLGPNGCGKSTLLKHLYRVLPVKSGQVRFDDEDLTAIPLRKAAQCIGVMAQFNTVNFDFTILQLVLMGRTPFKKGFDDDTDEDYALAEAALRRVGLWDRAYRRFSTLSGGEQQRVLLARVLCQKPEYLILDEPTNHLDITYQLELLAVIKELGIGVLAALHDLNLAAMFCDELCILKHGQVMAQGTPQEVLHPELLRNVYGVSSHVAYRLAVNGSASIPSITYDSPLWTKPQTAVQQTAEAWKQAVNE